jgi:hypothetical protein
MPGGCGCREAVDAGRLWMPGAGDALGGCGRVRAFDALGFGCRDRRRVPRSHFSPRPPRAQYPIPNPQ